ncbi:MAG TPA: hypothetical protein P5571_01585 [Candidatus Krumholzibacteria bacterium]|nr:hypothetical protein [Candidatus Krumholzibacteria bacterium]HRX50049.1 hypothetical protein [Candidatus Krumholzibacteria bacterium]
MTPSWNVNIVRAAAFGGYGATSRRTSMARSRRLISRGRVIGLALVVLVMLAFTGQVTVSNGIVGDSCRLAELEADRAYYQARIGTLELEWNRATRREDVVARAESELGLVRRGDPPRLVVLGPDAGAARGGRWPGWLSGLGGGTEAQAAEPRGAR